VFEGDRFSVRLRESMPSARSGSKVLVMMGARETWRMLRREALG
jgi:hypothetical protein